MLISIALDIKDSRGWPPMECKFIKHPSQVSVGDLVTVWVKIDTEREGNLSLSSRWKLTEYVQSVSLEGFW